MQPAARPDEPALDEPWLSFLLRYALPGMLATCLIAVGAFGVGWLPLTTDLVDNPAVDVLRTSGPGTLLSRVMVVVGVAMLLQSWLVVGYDLLTGPRQDVRRLTAVLAAWCAPLVLVPPLFSRDVYSYYVQGKLMVGGLDPYSAGVAQVPGWFSDGVDPMWGEAPTPYGPAFLLVERGVARFVGDDAYLGGLVFRLVAVAGVALLAYYLPRLAFAGGIDPGKALWLGVLNPLVIMHFVAGAHNDALMVALLVAGLALAAEGRAPAGVVLVTCAAAVKPIALIALPFVGLLWAGTRASWRHRILAWAKTVAVSTGVFAGLMLVAGVGLGWIGALTTPGSVRTWLSPSTSLGMLGGDLLSTIGLTETNDGAVTVVRLLGIAAAVVILVRLAVRPAGRTAVRGAALALLTVALLGPALQPWYLLWALPLFAASGLRPRELRATIALTACFVIFGIAETSATADSLLDLSDGVSIVAAVVVVILVVLASPRERALILGESFAAGLLPEDRPAQARQQRLVIRSA
ncbi:MAG: hypothetical protein EPO13_00925 [Actinomycetota bacterium]|nr:MAG: hypothetical protein EPO13_00925 [Actinomycetota bacterium]